MGRQIVQDQQAGFASGLNTVTEQAFLRPDQARRMENYRLSAYGAALKRLGTILTTNAPLATNDSTFYGGIYWPSRDQIFAIGGNTASSALTLYETVYPAAMPATWTTIGAVTQYRPVIFTDGTWPEVMYLAGDNTKLAQKAAPAFNTVTVDSRNAGTSSSSASSLTWSHAVGAGSDRALLVFLATSNQGASSVKWDTAGTNLSFTKLGAVSDGATWAELWYLVNPPNATKVITVTLIASARCGAASASYTSVNQTTPFETTSPRTANGVAGTQPSVMLPTGPNDKTVDLVADGVAETLSQGAGQTVIAANAFLSASDESASDAMSWTGATGAWVQIAASLAPSLSGTGLAITSLPSSTTAVSGLIVYNSRLWGWNTAGQSNSLFYSNLSTATNSIGGDSLGDAAKGGGEIIISTFGLSGIVACAVVGSSLLIFHVRGVSRLTGFGQDTITVTPQSLTGDVGMSNGTADGICVYGNVAYFVTDRGIYYATESFVSPLGTPEKPDPTSPLLTAGTTDPSKFILRFNRQYNEVWISIKGVGIYIFNTILGAWSGPFTGTYATGTQAIWEVVQSSTGLPHLWRTTFTNAQMFVSECDRNSIYKDDVPSAGTGGTVVTASLQMHRMFCGDRVMAKTFRWCNILASLPKGAALPNVIFNSVVDGDPNSATVTLPMTTAIGGEMPNYLSPGGQGAFLDVTIVDQITNGTPQYALATVQGNFLGQR